MLYLPQRLNFLAEGIPGQETPPPMRGFLFLLNQPGQFFRSFGQHRSNWLVAYVGYYLITIAGSLGAWNAAGSDPLSALVNSLLRALLDGAFSMVFFGVMWMYFGSRLVMGQTSLTRTVQAVGYAFLWPGLLGAGAVLLPLAVPSATAVLAPASLIVRLLAGLWAMYLAAIALKSLNSLDWRRTLIAVGWLPLTLAALAAASIVLAGGIAPPQ